MTTTTELTDVKAEEARYIAGHGVTLQDRWWRDTFTHYQKIEFKEDEGE